MIGKLYVSETTTRGSANFQSIPFHSASIDWKSEEASTMTFKSPIELSEATRVRYESDNTSFGGQIYKKNRNYGDDYTYDVISYLRLYQDKVTCSYSNLTSSAILKKVLKLSRNDFSTGGVTETSAIHSNLKWDTVSIWDIACQLCWLERQAGYECKCYIDSDGTLQFGYMTTTQEGYSFNSAIDYEEDYDSSDFITSSIVTFDGTTVAVANSNSDLIAKWGYITDYTECQAESNSTTTTSTTTTSTSLKDTSQISKYNIASSVVTQALSVAKTGNSDYANLKLLYTWCDKNIAYQSYSNTKYGAAGTLSKRKGNCCDNANLLIAMARSVGIKARYCHAHHGNKGHVWGEYYVNNKWFTCDTGVTSTGNYWGSHSNYAGSVTARYDTLPF